MREMCFFLILVRNRILLYKKRQKDYTQDLTQTTPG